MSTAPLVSVILPVYDPGPYFLPCLQSLAAQSYPHLEVLLVDDGSTDGSAELARRFAEGDPRFCLYRQPNQGAAQARANGLRRARGEYVILMDSDDLTHPGMVTALVEACRVHQAPLAFCRFAPFADAPPADGPIPQGQLLTGAAHLDMLLHDQRLDYALSNKLFAKGVLMPEMLECPYRYNEDLLASWRAFLGVDRAVFLDFDGYYCRQHAGSTSHQGITRPFLTDQWAVAKQILADCPRAGLAESGEAFYVEKLLYLYSMILRQPQPGPLADLVPPLRQELAAHWPRARRSPALRPALKAVYAASLYAPPLWRLACRALLRDRR